MTSYIPLTSMDMGKTFVSSQQFSKGNDDKL